MIEKPKLPFDEGTLDPFLSSEQVSVHFSKHHQQYFENLTKLISGTKFEKMDLEEIIKQSTGMVANNALQIWNHTFFWNGMSKDENNPDEDVLKLIEASFQSLDDFKSQFKNKGTKVFGSGWVWLVYEPTTDTLAVQTTSNANRPTSHPLLVCDVWEHSYYIDYQNRRGEYLTKFLLHINWEFVKENLTKARENANRG